MLRLICTIILVFLLILIPMLFMRGSISLVVSIVLIVILVPRILRASRNLKDTAQKTVSTYREKAARERQMEEEAGEEDREYVRIYAGKAPIPADAKSRSDYIRWLMENGHYEEADRIQSL